MRSPALGDGSPEKPLGGGMESSSVPTLTAPADWPKTVTLPGSPKAAMFSCTHSRAATWSSRPRLAVPSQAKRLPSYDALVPCSNMPPGI